MCYCSTHTSSTRHTSPAAMIIIIPQSLRTWFSCAANYPEPPSSSFTSIATSSQVSIAAVHITPGQCLAVRRPLAAAQLLADWEEPLISEVDMCDHVSGDHLKHVCVCVRVCVSENPNKGYPMQDKFRPARPHTADGAPEAKKSSWLVEAADGGSANWARRGSRIAEAEMASKRKETNSKVGWVRVDGGLAVVQPCGGRAGVVGEGASTQEWRSTPSTSTVFPWTEWDSALDWLLLFVCLKLSPAGKHANHYLTVSRKRFAWTARWQMCHVVERDAVVCFCLRPNRFMLGNTSENMRVFSLIC